MANEKRLIDANDIDYENIMCSQDQLHWLNAIIERQPTIDAMEVVRCSECMMYEENKEAHTSICRRELNFLYAKPDGGCTYGRRKDGASDDR